jgi:ribosome-associated toxin RatA of RatAB toxin-antitoxin module
VTPARSPLLCVLLACVVTTNVAVALPRLTDDQRRRLTAGEVVVLDALPPGAGTSAQGGTAVAIVRATPEQVWRVLTDYRGHPRYYPRVTAVDVLEADERHALLRYHVAFGPFSFRFHMDKYPDPQRRRIEWKLAEHRPNSLFRENGGYWQIEEAAGATVVTYAIAVRTLVPGFLTFGSERDSLTTTVTAMRTIAEKRTPEAAAEKPATPAR